MTEERKTLYERTEDWLNNQPATVAIRFLIVGFLGLGAIVVAYKAMTDDEPPILDSHSEISVTVPADGGWIQVSDFEVEAGKSVGVAPKGSWTVVHSGAATTVGAAGDLDPEGRAKGGNVSILPESANFPTSGAKYGELVGRFGSGQPFSLGQGHVALGVAEGGFFLACNDDSPSDNTGAIEVTISLPKE